MKNLDDDVKVTFTQKGLAIGLVPVLIGENEGSVVMEGRYFWCEPLLDAVRFVADILNCGVAIIVTGDLEA